MSSGRLHHERGQPRRVTRHRPPRLLCSTSARPPRALGRDRDNPPERPKSMSATPLAARVRRPVKRVRVRKETEQSVMARLEQTNSTRAIGKTRRCRRFYETSCRGRASQKWAALPPECERADGMHNFGNPDVSRLVAPATACIRASSLPLDDGEWWIGRCGSSCGTPAGGRADRAGPARAAERCIRTIREFSRGSAALRRSS